MQILNYHSFASFPEEEKQNKIIREIHLSEVELKPLVNGKNVRYEVIFLLLSLGHQGDHLGGFKDESKIQSVISLVKEEEV